MDLSKVQDDCVKAFTKKWVQVGDSRLCINYAIFSCEELKLAKCKNSTISTDDLAFIISTKVLIDWDDVKDANLDNVTYSQLNAFNALANDLNFLNLVTELSFDRSKFV